MKLLETRRNELILTYDGITRLRIRYTDHHGWRIQSETDQRQFDDMGASQTLSAILNESREFPYSDFSEISQSDDSVCATAPDSSRAVISFTDGSVTFFSPSGNVSARITGLRSDEENSCLSGILFDGDAVYGSGERFDQVNLRGKKSFLYTFDIWDQIFAIYLAIPVFGFSRGSGLFMNRYEAMEYDFGCSDPSEWSISVRKAPIDCYVFASDRLSDVLYGYSSLSGFARKPEDWTYRMLVCRYAPDFSNERGIETAVSKMEEYDLPWEGMILEGWDTYNPGKMQALKKICDQFHKAGKKVLLYTFIGNFHAEDLPDESYLLRLRSDDGKLYSSLPAVRPGVLNPDFGEGVRGYKYPDLTDPDVRKWYFGDVWGTLAKEIGVDGAKIDFCELLPDSEPLITRNGKQAPSGAHHWWPTVYNTLYYDLLSSKEGGGMCFSRGGGIGSQRNPFLWGGDQRRTFDRLRRQVVCMLESGLSGVPFITFDLAGYQYPEYAHSLYDENGKHYFQTSHIVEGAEKKIPICPIEEESKVFLRGLSFCTFTANMQTHGKVRRPYDFAEEGDRFTTDVYREYVKLHDRLIPYISECADVSCGTGLPIMRHLILGFQKDTNVYDIDDEYLFGDFFLVAPLLDERETREIYLPEGCWEDLLNGTVYNVSREGMRLRDFPAAYSEIPVFFRVFSQNQTAENAKEEIKKAFAFIRMLRNKA